MSDYFTAAIGAGLYGMLGILGASLFGRDEDQTRLEEIRASIAQNERNIELYEMLAESDARILASPDITPADAPAFAQQMQQCHMLVRMMREKNIKLASEAKELAARIEAGKDKKQAEYREQTTTIPELRKRIAYLEGLVDSFENREDITDRVRAFMETMGQPVSESARIPIGTEGMNLVHLRAKLILEEAIEFAQAVDVLTVRPAVEINNIMSRLEFPDLRDIDLVAAADALADLDYVVEGARLTFGIPREPIERAVHEANMRKLDGPIAPDGKRLKPEGWVGPEPEIEKALIEAGWVK